MPEAPDPEWWECGVGLTACTFGGQGRTPEPVRFRGSLSFPERTVLFVFAGRSAMARLVSGTDTVAELRLGRDTAAFFIGAPREAQDGWIAAFVDLIKDGRSETAPAVCLLDTGINRAHPLISVVLAANDLHAVRADWGVDDHAGHGTELAGLALYGDLTPTLQAMTPRVLQVGLESVKLLPPHGFPATAPVNFGLVTQQAVAIQKSSAPIEPASSAWQSAKRP